MTALQRSQALSNTLKQDIHDRGGFLSFADFMERALYHPQWGYYTAPDFSIGKTGDFTTAPELSPLFARSFVRPLLAIAERIGTTTLLEIGAGTGRFAHDLLRHLERYQALPDHYFIYEISETLREKQAAFLQMACPHLYSRITWLSALPTQFVGTIIANEVLDALPVHCFSIENHTIKERGVTLKDDAFSWQLHAPTTDLLAQKADALRTLYDLKTGYTSEINLRLAPFLQSVTASLQAGVVLFIDYGYGQAEYYHPERNRGSLTCFYQHHRHDNPLIHPGLQDITAHVDFTRVIEEASERECDLLGFTSQAAFLLDGGLMDEAQKEEENCTMAEQVNLHHAIKLLTLPTEMGERIKVMALGKNTPAFKVGFRLQDRRRDL